MNSGWVLAVDFGTTNTAAAVGTPQGEVNSVRLSTDADQMPSCVFDDGDGLVAGQAAAHQALLAPECFERSPKRRLGEPVVLLGEREWETVDLVAAVLRRVADRVMRLTAGAGVDRVVLTHPEGWGQQRCGALREAADRAGLGQVQLLSEPVAAAAWYLRAGGLSTGGPVAVFDFGGGTCDVAVLHATAAGSAPVVVDSSAGEDHLGGDHIDAKLVNWVLGELRTRGEGALADALADPDHPEWWLTLRDQVRGAKHALSEYPSAHVAVRAGSSSTTVLVTVEEFEKLISEDVERAISLTRRVLDDARVADSGLAAFFCTGGSSHIPLVHRRLTQLLGGPPATLHDPKLVVALGAATTAQLTPPQPRPPGPPRNLIAHPSDGSVSLQFDPPVPEADRPPATAYRAIADPGGATAQAPGSPIHISGLRNGVPHAFRVIAANASGWGDAATAVATPNMQPTGRRGGRNRSIAIAAISALTLGLGAWGTIELVTGPPTTGTETTTTGTTSDIGSGTDSSTDTDTDPAPAPDPAPDPDPAPAPGSGIDPGSGTDAAPGAEEAFPNPEEQALLQSLPANYTCERYTSTEPHSDGIVQGGAVVAVSCLPFDRSDPSLPDQVTFAAFSTMAGADYAYDFEDAGRLSVCGTSDTLGGAYQDPDGVGGGRYGCFTFASGEATLLWTHDPDPVYAFAYRQDGNLDALFEWFVYNPGAQL